MRSGFAHVLIVAALFTAACNARHEQISRSGKGALEAALTTLGDGFAVGWYDTREGTGEIYIRLLDADGHPTGPEQRLTNDPESSYEVSLAPLGDDLVVGWYDQERSGRQTARLGRWTRDGTNRWVKALGPDTRNPVVLSAGSGVFAAWIQMEDEGHEAVFAGWWEADGRPRSAPMRLGLASKTTWNLNAALDASGTAWVVFDADVSTRASEVYIVRADASGAEPVRLTDDDGAPSKYPDLAIAGGGRAALSWQDDRDGNTEVYLFTAPLSDMNAAIDGRGRRVTTTAGESIGAYIAWNGDRLGLAWSDKTEGQHELYFESFTAEGVPREPPRRLTQTATWSLIPAIRPRRNGFALAWTEYSPAGETHDGTAEVFFTSVP
jgi:hypothetical protein